MAKEIAKKEERTILPPVDIFENENEITIYADMPGAQKDGIDISIENNILAIRGRVADEFKNMKNVVYAEYELADYYRTFEIEDIIDVEKVSAKLENGILKVVLPKKEEVKPRKIPIEVS